MDKFVFKRKLPVWKLILGCAALLIGIISIFITYKSAFILIGLAVFLLLVEGSEFDFKTNKYRQIKSIFGISVGAWKSLPKIEYVSVFKTLEKITLRQTSAEANVVNTIFKLNLFHNKNRKIEAYFTYDETDAFKKAEEIATLLDIRILDATTSKFKWVK